MKWIPGPAYSITGEVLAAAIVDLMLNGSKEPILSNDDLISVGSKALAKSS
jgi:hypothetical protein